MRKLIFVWLLQQQAYPSLGHTQVTLEMTQVTCANNLAMLPDETRMFSAWMSDWFNQKLGYVWLASMIFVPVQPVDATQALNLSAGVSNPRVLRGRSLSWRATLFRWACEYTDRSAPFGKYCLSRPLVFSLEPRCHGLCGSQK